MRAMGDPLPLAQAYAVQARAYLALDRAEDELKAAMESERLARQAKTDS